MMVEMKCLNYRKKGAMLPDDSLESFFVWSTWRQVTEPWKIFWLYREVVLADNNTTAIRCMKALQYWLLSIKWQELHNRNPILIKKLTRMRNKKEWEEKLQTLCESKKERGGRRTIVSFSDNCLGKLWRWFHSASITSTTTVTLPLKEPYDAVLIWLYFI